MKKVNSGQLAVINKSKTKNISNIRIKNKLWKDSLTAVRQVFASPSADGEESFKKYSDSSERLYKLAT